MSKPKNILPKSYLESTPCNLNPATTCIFQGNLHASPGCATSARGRAFCWPLPRTDPWGWVGVRDTSGVRRRSGMLWIGFKRKCSSLAAFVWHAFRAPDLGVSINWSDGLGSIHKGSYCFGSVVVAPEFLETPISTQPSCTHFLEEANGLGPSDYRKGMDTIEGPEDYINRRILHSAAVCRILLFIWYLGS